ncbi:MAG: helix-turn-helix domain-containing protein [Candidatus Ancaeobacter aquaticus]|nr:helix-turn-helix domain-containing protein [Candidatus Ancaeobacter aquaticus]
MAEKDIIVIKQKELKHLHVIRKVLEKQIRQSEAGKILGLSTRQIRRKTKRVRTEGDKEIIH